MGNVREIWLTLNHGALKSRLSTLCFNPYLNIFTYHSLFTLKAETFADRNFVFLKKTDKNFRVLRLKEQI